MTRKLMVQKFIIAKTQHLYAILWRVRRGFDKMVIHIILPLFAKTQSGQIELQRLGTDYGGWTVPVNLLNESSICYCVGVGEDATFDFALADRFHCNVFSFDPTPASISYMERMKYDHTKLHFFPIGIWDEDTELRFYMPASDDETLLSVFDLQGTGKYIVCKCKNLSTIMQELGHKRIDLLKLDIEGAWRKVIKNIVEERMNISILCVELDSPTNIVRVLWAIRALASIGLVLIHFEKDNYLFVQKALLS